MIQKTIKLHFFQKEIQSLVVFSIHQMEHFWQMERQMDSQKLLMFHNKKQFIINKPIKIEQEYYNGKMITYLFLVVKIIEFKFMILDLKKTHILWLNIKAKFVHLNLVNNGQQLVTTIIKLKYMI